MKIDIITLGCSKNLVDSERLMRQLEAVGYEVTHDAELLTGDIAVVNTCGFIKNYNFKKRIFRAVVLIIMNTASNHRGLSKRNHDAFSQWQAVQL